MLAISKRMQCKVFTNFFFSCNTQIPVDLLFVNTPLFYPFVMEKDAKMLRKMISTCNRHHCSLANKRNRPALSYNGMMVTAFKNIFKILDHMESDTFSSSSLKYIRIAQRKIVRTKVWLNTFL